MHLTVGDGKRDPPDGKPFTPEVVTSSQFSSNTPELVKEYLRVVGVDVRITSLDPAAADEATTRGAYDLALIGYGGLGGDPDAGPRPLRRPDVSCQPGASGQLCL